MTATSKAARIIRNHSSCLSAQSGGQIVVVTSLMAELIATLMFSIKNHDV